MKIMMMAASLRKDSVNKKLINLAAQMVKETGCKVDLASFDEFDVPLYNADIQTSTGIAPGALKFIERMHACDAFILGSPEYNFSIPGTLKNLIDWVSRVEPMPWINQQILLLSASPSMVGGNRGLWHIRVPLEGCGAFVFPQMFGLASAYQAFTTEEQLQDRGVHQNLKQMIENFIKHVAKQ